MKLNTNADTSCENFHTDINFDTGMEFDTDTNTNVDTWKIPED